MSLFHYSYLLQFTADHNLNNYFTLILCLLLYTLNAILRTMMVEQQRVIQYSMRDERRVTVNNYSVGGNFYTPMMTICWWWRSFFIHTFVGWWWDVSRGFSAYYSAQRLIRRVGQEVADACSTDLNHKIWNTRRSGKIVYCNVVVMWAFPHWVYCHRPAATEEDNKYFVFGLINSVLLSPFAKF